MILKIIPALETVKKDGWVNFQGVDSWYHLRLIENLLHHFPDRINFDPYTYFPYGQDVFFAPFHDLLYGFITKIVTFGSSSIDVIENALIYIPPVLGSLVAIPVYFVGRALFDRKAGLIAALLVVIFPSQLMNMSTLGFLDHHVSEVFFSTVTAALLLLAVKSAFDRGINFTDFKSGNRGRLKLPLILGALCGLSLGLYLLTWVGGLLFLFIFYVWGVLMFIIHFMRKQSYDYLSIILPAAFIITFIVVLPLNNQLAYGDLNIFSLIVAVITFPVLWLIAKFIEKKDFKRILFPATLVVIAGLAVGGLFLINPKMVSSITGKFDIFFPSAVVQTIAEVRPILFATGEFSLSPFWNTFTTGAILAPIGLILVIIKTVKNREPHWVLFSIWSILILMATFGQIRFGEYLTVSFALLAAFVLGIVVNFIPSLLKWLGIFKPEVVEVDKYRHKSKKEKKVKKKGSLTGYYTAYSIIAAIVIFLPGIFPNIQPSIKVAQNDSGLDSRWYEALVWMRDNTPEPFGDADYFYAYYDKSEFSYPDSAYGVMNWWSFGHYITQISQRIPISNPHQSGAGTSAHYYMETDPAKGNEILEDKDTKYIIIDLDTATPYTSGLLTRRYPNIVTWAGEDIERYCEIFISNNNGTIDPVVLYYPDYYRSMVTRLYNFNGQAVVPDNTTTVVTYVYYSGYKLIDSQKTFATYEEAEKYVAEQDTENIAIVGTSAFESPVPLEKLDGYNLVYQSEDTLVETGKIAPFLKIFEYAP